jgi:hypothetical protein
MFANLRDRGTTLRVGPPLHCDDSLIGDATPADRERFEQRRCSRDRFRDDAR